MIMVKHLGPNSRLFGRGAVGKLDGRSREGRFLVCVERELLDHIGPSATVTQRVLVGRAARAMLRLELLDERVLAGVDLSAHDGAVYGALNNTLRLALRELGLKGKPAKAPSLTEIAARHASEPAKPTSVADIAKRHEGDGK
jgi:hypothetical protein